MGALSACEDELPGPVSASLPRAFGDIRDPELRLALTPAETRALLVGSRLVGRPLAGLLVLAAQSRATAATVQRWSRPYCEPRGMLLVRVHLPTVEVAEAQVAAARFGIRPETYLVGRAFELLRERARAEPARWAFVGLSSLQQPEWQLLEGTALQLA